MATAREIWEFSTTGLNKVIGDLKQTDRALEGTRGSVDSLKGNISALGLAEFFRNSFAFASRAVDEFTAQDQALAQLRAGLASTNGVAGRTFDDLIGQANELSKTSLFGDDQILQGVTAQLLTFTGIAGEQFDRTQAAALDLAQRLGGDLQGASIQLGKALNDPVANLSALSRSGIQFSEDQKNVIAGLVATNRLADAQTLILDELSKQYGGSAAAATQTFSGQLMQMTKNFWDSTEPLGEALLPLIIDLGTYLQDIVVPALIGFATWLQENSVLVANIAKVIGILVAAYAIWTIGTTALAVAQTLLNIAMLANPYFAVIAGIAALVAVMVYLYNKFEAVRFVVNLVGKVFKAFYDFSIKPLFEGLKMFATWLYNVFARVFGWIGKQLGLVNKEAKELKGIADDTVLPDMGGGPENKDSGFMAGLSASELAALAEAGKGKGKGGGSKNIRQGISEITAAAPKVFNINIGSLIDNFTVETNVLKESESRIKEVVQRALLAAINDTQTSI